MENKVKPKFISGLAIIIWSGVTSTVGLVSDIVPFISENKIGIFPLNLIIAIIVMIFLVIVHTIIYINKLNKYCDNIQIEYNNLLKNRNSLIKDNDKYEKENLDLKNQLFIRNNIINDFITILNTTSLEPNDFEKKTINALLENILTKTKNIDVNGGKNE